jgi:hypothetical protein
MRERILPRMAFLRRLTVCGGALIVAAGAAAACGSERTSAFNEAPDAFVPVTDDAGNYNNNPNFGGPSDSGDNPIGNFAVTPDTDQIITVNVGANSPTVAYSATLDGTPVQVGWSVDRGDMGSIEKGPSTTATFVPKGTTGGLVTISAGLNGHILNRRVYVKLTSTQNGLDASNKDEQTQIAGSKSDLSKGGGIGGVGGEGLGPAVSDTSIINALNAPSPATDQGLAFLYPYDKTIWPRGQRAPLLMWTSNLGNADAVKIELATTSGSFSYTGTFGRPAVLSAGDKFIRHPIPQDVWDMATASTGKTLDGATDQLTVKLTVERAGTAYGPITQTWNVAPASLSGTVYYNSYGTQFVKNWVTPDKAGHAVGAAILSVRSGDTAPKLVIGKDSPLDNNGIPKDDSGCRVCHVVSSRGRWLISQSELGNPNNGRSFLYDLTQSNIQASAVQIPQEGVFGWAAMTNDGAYVLSNAVNPSSTNAMITNAPNGTATSSFWSFGASPAISTLSGLPSGVAAGYPAFSPDTTMIAYIDATSQTQNVHGALVVANYDASKQQFSNPQTIVSPGPGERIGFPSFLPDNSGIIYEKEVRPSVQDSVLVTRSGARSEIWWISLAAGATPVRLDALVGRTNGSSYLPSMGNNHGIPGASDPGSPLSENGYDDTTLSYEPTVLPIAVGGQAWVVFTSRRAYGNQLTAVPWQSWPPDYDTRNLAQATVKKLWVAAIDLGASAASDPSHPAFYLPSQEILAGNSRGFWVLDPCRTDGTSCDTGDQCCNGFCQPNGDAGALVCSNTPPNHQCSQTQEKCTSANDCCDKTQQCINGFCAQSVK